MVGSITPITGDIYFEINAALSSNQNGLRETIPFIIEPDVTIKSLNFVSENIDECSVYFDRGEISQYLIESNISGDSNKGCNFYFVNKSSSKIMASAKVICSERIGDLFLILDKENIILENYPDAVWEDETNFNLDKYCVVILQYTN
jgi:hypothetical protein